MPNLNRRGFIGSLIALAAVPFTPALAPVVASAPEFTPIFCDHEYGVDFEWESVEKALSMDEYFIGYPVQVNLPQRWKASDSLQPYLHKAMVNAAI